MTQPRSAGRPRNWTAGLLDRDNRRVLRTPAGGPWRTATGRSPTLNAATVHARRVQSRSAGTLHLGFTTVSAIGIPGPLRRLLGSEL